MSDDGISVPVGLTTEGLLGRRYLARCIDSVIIVILMGISVGILGALLSASAADRAGFVWIPMLVLLGWIGYGSVLESSKWQATLGKRIVGLRVYTVDGGRVRLLQAAGRALVKDGPFILFAILPGAQLLSLLWLVAHLVVLHRSPVYQAIHDRVAHTWVAAPESSIQLRLN